MKLVADPVPPLPVFREEVALVIRVGEEEIPEIYVQQGAPKPDRHLLLGMMQSVSMAIKERDPELAVFLDTQEIALHTESGVRQLQSGLIIVRAEDGTYAALVQRDEQQARRLASQALRWFTGTVRLDVP